jgi:hypothetical protein
MNPELYIKLLVIQQLTSEVLAKLEQPKQPISKVMINAKQAYQNNKLKNRHK